MKYKNLDKVFLFQIINILNTKKWWKVCIWRKKSFDDKLIHSLKKLRNKFVFIITQCAYMYNGIKIFLVISCERLSYGSWENFFEVASYFAQWRSPTKENWLIDKSYNSPPSSTIHPNKEYKYTKWIHLYYEIILHSLKEKI